MSININISSITLFIITRAYRKLRARRCAMLNKSYQGIYIYTSICAFAARVNPLATHLDRLLVFFTQHQSAAA